MNWLPDMDLNHDKQIQSLLCYRYTIRQARPNKASHWHAKVKSPFPLQRFNALTP